MITSGFRLAFRGLLPPLVAGGLLGGLCALAGSAHWSAALWTLCYGLALLATQEFAPRSLVWLGRTFFLDRPTPARLVAWRRRAQVGSMAAAGYAHAAYGLLLEDCAEDEQLYSLYRESEPTQYILESLCGVLG